VENNFKEERDEFLDLNFEEMKGLTVDEIREKFSHMQPFVKRIGYFAVVDITG